MEKECPENRSEEGARSGPVSREEISLSGERVPVPDRYLDSIYYRDEVEAPPLFRLAEALNSILKRRWLIIGGVFISALLTGLYIKLQAPVFKAAARFLPSMTQDTSSRIDRAFGTGAAYDPNAGNILSEYYTNLLTSRPLLERVIKKKFIVGEERKESDLIAYYKAKGANDDDRLTNAIRLFRLDLSFSAPRQTGYGRQPSIMSIGFSAKGPRLAADVANEMLAQLTLYIQDIKDSKTAKSRQFIESQLADTQKLLRTAEADQAAFLSRNKKIVTPDLEAERDRFRRNVTVQEEVFITLKKQLELAKIEEQEKKPSIEIIEQAFPPLKPSRPSAKKNVMIAGVLSLFFFSFLAIGLDWIQKIDLNKPDNMELNRTLDDIKGDARKIGRLFGLARPKPGKR
jgi:uncharacterized protein involved in exopolysaccharide biosynthesis